MKVSEIEIASRNAAAETKRMPSANIGQRILKGEMFLDDVESLSIPTECHRTRHCDFGKLICHRSSNSDIRPFEEFLLNCGRFSAMETDFRLIEQPRAKRISMSNREVPQSIVCQPRKSGRWRAAQIRGRQRLVLC